MENDLEQLKLLSIFHYVVAGITALIACFPIMHLVVGISMLTGTGLFGQAMAEEQLPFPFSAFGLLFTILPAVMILGGWGLAVCMVIAGRNLTKKTNRTFCMVIAGISCAFAPFGTALGIFTLIVLSRPSCKELFNISAPPLPVE